MLSAGAPPGAQQGRGRVLFQDSFKGWGPECHVSLFFFAVTWCGHGSMFAEGSPTLPPRVSGMHGSFLLLPLKLLKTTTFVLFLTLLLYLNAEGGRKRAASMTPKNAQCKKGSRSGEYFGNPAASSSLASASRLHTSQCSRCAMLCVAPGRAHDECAQGGRAKGGRASSGSHGGGGRPAARRRCSQGGALRTAGSSLSPPSLTALPWCSARRRGPRLAPGSAPPSARLPRPPAPAREVGVSAGWLAAGSASASGVEKCTAAARPQQGDRARAGGRACGRAGGR